MKIKQLFSVLILVITILASCTTSNPNHPNPAESVLIRTLGEQASRFELLLEKTNDTLGWFETEVKNNKIYIKGNTDVALARGAYHYIKENNFGLITWEATNVKIPNQLKNTKYDRVTTSMPYRIYVNPCTYGYTMAWWTWERWEKELDWMALHGINMPLALIGQEIIWQEVWEDFGIEKSKLSDYSCGPAFLPWFRMGNIYDYKGPLPQSWMDKDKDLQKKILNRMKELNMHPILPAFSGHVPKYFQTAYPDAKIYKLQHWGGVESKNASYLLDPKDPLFMKIGKLFLEKYKSVYGSSNLFLADPFNEMSPPVSGGENKNSELAEYGEVIYKSIKEFNPNATWVLQGWGFGYSPEFWTPKATKAFLSRIPQKNVIMLNYSEDRFQLWKKMDAFYGAQWTFGYVHNYGGQQSLFGDLNLYYDHYKEVINSPNKGNLVGYGSLPEAIENNSIAYEYIFDVPWGGTNKTVLDWTRNHLMNRYGKLDSKVEKAWKIALKNTYAVREWHLRGTDAIVEDTIKNYKLGYGTYLHNQRPTTATNVKHLGNPSSIKSVLKLFIEAYEAENNDLLFYDIIDFAQHYTGCKADIKLVNAVNNYHKGNSNNGDIEFNKVKDLLAKLDVLQVETGGSFTKWCEDAVSHATTEEEKVMYLQNAKTQITIWAGPNLKDYASKSWSGMLKDFYIPRWEMLFNDMKKDKENFDLKATRKKITKWEEQWTLETSIPKSPERLGKKAYIELIKEIISE